MACPRLVSNFFAPRLMWYQTDLTVVIRILLIDVSDYYLRVETDHLIFSTTTEGKEYYLILYLFGPVIAEKTTHKNAGREIKIYLTKGLKWFPWTRLTLSKEKDPLIAYDLSHIDETDNIKRNHVERESFEEYKRRNNIQYIMPVVPSSDEEDSEEEQLDFLRYA